MLIHGMNAQMMAIERTTRRRPAASFPALSLKRKNTAVGISEVDAALLQAAQGMGMTNLQRFWRVEVPLAIPVIFAGVRTASVMAIGLASIAAYIGAGGLGVLIFQGISTGNTEQVLTGAVAVSVLALLADAILASVQTGLRWSMGMRA